VHFFLSQDLSSLQQVIFSLVADSALETVLVSWVELIFYMKFIILILITLIKIKLFCLDDKIE
jgi:hypothetical protein